MNIRTQRESGLLAAGRNLTKLVTSSRLAMLVLFSFVLTSVQLPAGLADETDSKKTHDQPDAKVIALRAHSEARAIDRLPSFFYRVESGNGDIASMLDMEDWSLPLLKKTIDESVSDNRRFQATETFAWDPRQGTWSMSDMRFKNETQESTNPTGRQDWVWTNREAFQRSDDSGRPARFVYVRNRERVCEGRIHNFGYLRVTPHQFWGGHSRDHNDTISHVPPEKGAYQYIRSEEFDNELCDVVQSAARAETLWVSRESGRLRGVLTHRYRSGAPTDSFYQTEFVTKLAGRPITSRREFAELVQGLSEAQSIELSIAWNEKYFESFGPNELIRLRDYREIAEGVWIPFREDRAWTHPAANGSRRRKYIHLWLAVKEARTDVDLTETVQNLQPRDGDDVQDQRHGVVLNYRFGKDRTESELLAMVDAEYQKQAANEKLLKNLVAPIDALVGKPAPALPTDGWIGGDAPQVQAKPYLVHFWATWCGPCKNDLPQLKKLAADGVRIIGMHPAGVSTDAVAKVVAERELGYPTFVASGTSNGSKENIGGYPAGIFPYCILVDGTGRVAGHGSLGPELMAKLRGLNSENEGR